MLNLPQTLWITLKLGSFDNSYFDHHWLCLFQDGLLIPASK